MPELLPALPVQRVAPYVQARIQAILDRLIPRYWAHEVSTQELYGALGAIAELQALLADIDRQQRQREPVPRDSHGTQYEPRR